MGYLNNTSRVLDAILTKKGREILSSGGDFAVTKFALGDDEIDYSLWDTTHTNGTDYYGAVIDNLPALEPFNDPSEIMKYKLVTRSPGTGAMEKIIDGGNTATNLVGLKFYADEGEGGTNRITVNSDLVTTKLGHGTNGNALINITKIANVENGNLDHPLFSNELYTVTLLDSSVAILGPTYDLIDGNNVINLQNDDGTLSPTDRKWVPFVDNVQHISQTVSGCILGAGNNLNIGTPGNTSNLRIYPKRLTATTSTSIIITGESSGAVLEFPITITYS